ncbi:MAG: hypothetical protein KJT03_02400 [Verrucomicrobiae bacterium]|nr:hypothetical protein [Verrucomicrobiae bacterium]
MNRPKKTSLYPIGSHLVFLIFLNCQSLFAQEEAETSEEDEKTPAKFYRSPEERREAGLGTPLTDWLTFYGLLEAEYEYSKTRYRENGHFSSDHDTEAVQLGFEAEFTEMLLGEFVLEMEYDNRYRAFMDEAVLALEFDSWAIKAGIQNLDFGEYYSHFVIGPLLEFGETRKWTLSWEQELNDYTDFLVYTFERENSLPGNDLGYGVAMEWVSGDEAIRIGSGIMSDLRESDDFFGEEDYASSEDVPGWNLYALVGFESFEITAEIVAATDHFILEDERIRPWSSNLEFAYFLNYDFQIAARVEYTKELIEEPEWQTGLSITWLLGEHLILSIDYLNGSFEKPLEIEEDELYLKTQDLIAVQLGLEF